jgi:hypothetical protein
MNKQETPDSSKDPQHSAQLHDNILEQHLALESKNMCKYALSNGYEVPSTSVKRLSALTSFNTNALTEDNIAELAEIHQQLSRIIAPATPQAVVLQSSNGGRRGLLDFFGAVPIVREIMLVSMLFLVAFIVIGQLEVINEVSLKKGVLDQSGWQAIAVMSYLICCAGLGACFTALYRLNSFVAKTTYDPRYDSTYWASILLGVIAGIFISELLFHLMFSAQGQASAAGASPLPSHNMGKPVLALLGGFSANMVYKVLQRLVDSMESLVKGDPSDINQAKRETDMHQLKSLKKEMHMDVANRLVALKTKLNQDPEQAQDQLHLAINDLLSKK